MLSKTQYMYSTHLASARAALCKDPEGEIEKLMEGQTVEKVTGEQAQEDAQQ